MVPAEKDQWNDWNQLERKAFPRQTFAGFPSQASTEFSFFWVAGTPKKV